MKMNQIYALVRTDDYSSSVKAFVGFYSTQELANKGMGILRKYSPDFYNFHIEPLPFDNQYLFDPEEDKIIQNQP